MPQTHGCLHSPRARGHQGTSMLALQQRMKPRPGHAHRAWSRKAARVSRVSTQAGIPWPRTPVTVAPACVGHAGSGLG